MLKTVTLLLSIAAFVATSPNAISPLERQILLQSDLNTKQSADPDYRLTNNIVPVHYEVLLHPYFVDEGSKVAFTFDGTIRITVRATVPNQSSITLLANRLNVGNDWVVHEELNPSVVLPHPDYIYEAVTHKLTLHLNRVLRNDINYVISMSFTGEMADDMAGFYRSYYNDGGVKKWLGSTQFQMTEARRAFPCFDEPKFKATFRISIERPASFQPTLSNTRIDNTIMVTQNVSRDTFKITPKMSSYLIAFIVSDYRGRQTPNLVHGMYAPPPSFDQIDYSLNFANNVLQKLDDFTGYPYLSVPELEKLDQAAVPDFSAGAMENWGLMTYRETSILFHPQHSTALNKHRIAAVITHEAAHQWFGDLVTCDWWDATWLNEGFARYFQYFGTLWVEDGWELEKIYIVEQLQSVFQMDSLTSTHPMTSEVNSPGQISAIFDNISYNKGSAVIRMLEHLVGSERFKLSLQDYLRTNAYGSTRPENLWTAFQNRVPERQITRIMDPWTTQGGYPYVTVTVNGASVSVTQRRFLLKDKDHEDMTTWAIPLTYATQESEFLDTQVNQIYYKEDGSIKTFTLPQAPSSYFVMNNQQIGYYRVNYDAENWMKIKEALQSENHGGIHVLNRAQIVDDLFNFARAGIVNYGTAFEILDYIKAEKHYVPWLAFFNGLTHITRRITTAEDLELLEFYVLDILEDIYEHVGFNAKATDTQTVIYTRNNVLSWLCRYGHENCLTNARNEFGRFVAAPTTHLVKPDHRAVVYCEGLRNGTASDFNLLWNRFLTTNVGHEQVTILNALGCTKDPAMIRQLLTVIISDSIRYQDKGTAFSSALSGNPENLEVVYEWMTTNYNAWAANYSFNGMGAVASSFSSIADRFTTTAQITRLNTFLNANQVALGAGTVQSIRNAITEVEWQMVWASENAPTIREFFTDKWENKDNDDSATSVTVSLACMMLATFVLALLH